MERGPHGGGAADATHARTICDALHVSHAVMSGKSLHVAGHRLGNRRGSITNRYVHLDNAALSQVAERVAAAIEQKVRARQ